MVESRREDSQIEEIEGIGEDEISLGSDYPIDDVLIRNEGRTIYEFLGGIRRGDYIMAPDFQRDFVWNESKQSRLIESVLMRVPLPALYFAENESGRLVVVDGLQRLSTFRQFVEGGSSLSLRNSEYNGKRFADLPYNLQRRIGSCYMLVYIIDARVPDRLKFDIFRRVNSGVPLTRPQMRNAVFNGKGTRFLREEAHSRLFKQVTGGIVPTFNMMDRELVNRFCAFDLLGSDAYRGDDGEGMHGFLDDAVAHMNKMDDQDLKKLGERFQRGLGNNYRVFHKNAFRILTRDNRISPFNSCLWDVMLIELSQRDADLVDSRRKEVLEGLYEGLLEDRDFYRALTVRPGTPDLRYTQSAVKTRFSRSRTIFRRVFGD